METELLTDLRYGPYERNLTDIAFPADAKGNVDLVLMIHGGGWIAGEKELYRNEILDFAKGGVVSASINYRYISDESNCFDIIDDITAALEKIKSTAAERGIEIKKALLTGLSAGGHLSLLYAYMKKTEAPVTPVAVVALSGPTDMASDEAVYKFTHGNEMGDSDFVFALISKLCGAKITEDNFRTDEIRTIAKKVSPLYFVNESTVPTVICHAVNDKIVPFCNAVSLEKALSEHNVEHELIAYPTASHVLCDDKECIQKKDELTNEYIKKYLSGYKN